MVVCLERCTDLHMAQLMPLPLTVFCFSKIQIGFTFLVLAHLGSPGQKAVKRVCVCVCACVRACMRKIYYTAYPMLNIFHLKTIKWHSLWPQLQTYTAPFHKMTDMYVQNITATEYNSAWNNSVKVTVSIIHNNGNKTATIGITIPENARYYFWLSLTRLIFWSYST